MEQNESIFIEISFLMKLIGNDGFYGAFKRVMYSGRTHVFLLVIVILYLFCRNNGLSHQYSAALVSRMTEGVKHATPELVHTVTESLPKTGAGLFTQYWRLAVNDFVARVFGLEKKQFVTEPSSINHLKSSARYGGHLLRHGWHAVQRIPFVGIPMQIAITYGSGILFASIRRVFKWFAPGFTPAKARQITTQREQTRPWVRFTPRIEDVTTPVESLDNRLRRGEVVRI